MPTVLLVRHGRSTANTSGVLAGWTPGVALDDRGREQAEALALRLGGLPLAAIVSSPLQRCQETVAPLVKKSGGKRVTERRLGECRYGDWTGRKLSDLVKEPMWRVVQAHPSAAVFPGPDGESMAAMAARGVAAIRSWDAKVAATHGPGAVWVACSHGDVIKAIVADAMGLHLDNFQRIVVDPGSVTAITYTETRPFVLRVNDVGGDVTAYQPPPPKKRRRRRSSDAVVGGGAGA
ncbi:MAG TPA: histidine phosphatase family protein [Sporichthya sp.]|nr:histidine phosphatase family protein [Sporichthya sp.]